VQEVILRAISTVIDREVTLDGRLIDVLTSVGLQRAVTFAAHPMLLIALTLGGRDNPDRLDPVKSATLDAVLSTVVEGQTLPIREALYTCAVLCRENGLDGTADMAVELLSVVRNTAPEYQAQAVETRIVTRQTTVAAADPDYSWLLQIMATFAAFVALAAAAAKVTGNFREAVLGIKEAIDSVTE
jgi:hypothetical protein